MLNSNERKKLEEARLKRQKLPQETQKVEQKVEKIQEDQQNDQKEQSTQQSPANNNTPAQLTFRLHNINGNIIKNITLKLVENETISDVRQRIAKQLSIPSEEITLIFAGKILTNSDVALQTPVATIIGKEKYPIFHVVEKHAPELAPSTVQTTTISTSVPKNSEQKTISLTFSNPFNNTDIEEYIIQVDVSQTFDDLTALIAPLFGKAKEDILISPVNGPQFLRNSRISAFEDEITQNGIAISSSGLLHIKFKNPLNHDAYELAEYDTSTIYTLRQCIADKLKVDAESVTINFDGEEITTTENLENTLEVYADRIEGAGGVIGIEIQSPAEISMPIQTPEPLKKPPAVETIVVKKERTPPEETPIKIIVAEEAAAKPYEALPTQKSNLSGILLHTLDMIIKAMALSLATVFTLGFLFSPSRTKKIWNSWGFGKDTKKLPAFPQGEPAAMSSILETGTATVTATNSRNTGQPHPKATPVGSTLKHE